MKREEYPDHMVRSIEAAERAQANGSVEIGNVHPVTRKPVAQKIEKPLPIAKGRIRDSGMNKTEARYAELLESRKIAGEIIWYLYEGWTFKMADDTRYTPDFAVLLSNNEIECHEVKGAKVIFRDDAKVKLKVAARMFPIRFRLIFPKPGGGWDISEL
jgi:hypothetical protein